MVFVKDGIPYRLYVGKEFTISNNLNSDFKEALKKKLDFIVLPLFHPLLLRDKYSINKRIEPLAKADILIEDSQKWNNSIVSRISADLDLESPFENIRRKSKFLLKQEIKYAIHIGLYALILPSPQESSPTNYSRIINKILINGTGPCQLWITIPLTNEFDYWEIYNEFRFGIKNSNYLGVCLEIGNDLPDDVTK